MDEVEFEAGQRWSDGTSVLLCEKYAEKSWYCSDGSIVTEDQLCKHFHLFAPAPKPWQRWSNGSTTVRIADHYGGLAVVGPDGRDLTVEEWCDGSVVSVARWLQEHGYKTGGARQFDGTWPLFSEPAKPRVELRDGMRVRHVASDIVGTLRAIESGLWRMTWHAESGDHVGPSRSQAYVLEQIEDGFWIVVEEAPKPAVRLRDGMRIMDSTDGRDRKATLALEGDSRVVLTFNGLGGTYTSSTSVDDAIARIEKGWWVVLDDAPSVETPAAPPVWDRAASRRAVDEAVARLRGEPFAEAVRAALVDASECGTLTQQEILAVAACCMEWERRRGEVAPGRRELTESQRTACARHVARFQPNDSLIVPFAFADWIGDIYERARSADKPAMLGRPNRGGL